MLDKFVLHYVFLLLLCCLGHKYYKMTLRNRHECANFTKKPQKRKKLYMERRITMQILMIVYLTGAREHQEKKLQWHEGKLYSRLNSMICDAILIYKIKNGINQLSIQIYYKDVG